MQRSTSFIPGLLVAAVVFIVSCSSLPPANLTQVSMAVETRVEGDSLWIDFSNPAPIPMRLSISSSDPHIDGLVNTNFVIGSIRDTSLAFHVPDVDTTDLGQRMTYSFTLGSLDTPIRANVLSWPFPKGQTSEIIQGYEGAFSHQSDYSRNALDFRMAPGDTVTAADDGMVAGVIEGYDLWGDDPSYRPYANFITLYHAHSGLLTQYVHLAYEGSFVAVGDTVHRGQPIGLVGRSGFTTVDHLHFNVLVPDSTDGIVSFPVFFEGELDGASLKRGDVVSHAGMNQE
jgi:murein DD-endopeptidase MepM/ murein hydrolase activator NlpD